MRLVSASISAGWTAGAPAGVFFNSATAAAAASARVRASPAIAAISSLRRPSTPTRSPSALRSPSSVAMRFASAGSVTGGRGVAITVSKRAIRPARSSTAFESPATSGGLAAASRSWFSTRASRVSTATRPSSRPENTPANASTSKVSTTPPATAATTGQGKFAKSDGSHARSRSDTDGDAAASSGVPLVDSPPTSVAFRSMVGGRRPRGPAGPPGGSLELVMSCPLAIHLRPRHTIKSRASERRNCGAHGFTRLINSVSVGRSAIRRPRAPAAASGSATCCDRQ